MLLVVVLRDGAIVPWAENVTNDFHACFGPLCLIIIIRSKPMYKYFLFTTHKFIIHFSVIWVNDYIGALIIEISNKGGW